MYFRDKLISKYYNLFPLFLNVDMVSFLSQQLILLICSGCSFQENDIVLTENECVKLFLNLLSFEDFPSLEYDDPNWSHSNLVR